MRRWQSVLVLVAVASGFAASFVLLQRVIGASSPWLGLLAMFYFLGLAKFAEPLVLLRMPRPLRAIDTHAGEKPIHRLLLVPQFGNLLRRTPLRLLNTAVYLDGAGGDVARVLRHAEAAEASHFWAAVLFTPYIVYVWASGQRAVAAFFLAVQVAFNLYPILHLRAVRARLGRLRGRARKARRPQAASPEAT